MSETTRELKTEAPTTVSCKNEPKAGGDHHVYKIRETVDEGLVPRGLSYIFFQHGIVEEKRVNGCFVEDLLAISLDRIMYYQMGEFACEENEKAMEHIETAMRILKTTAFHTPKQGEKAKDK